MATCTGAHKYVSVSIDLTENTVASAAVPIANILVVDAVEGWTIELSFSNKRTHVTGGSRILDGRFKLCLWPQILCWSQKLGFGNLLAIDAGVKLTLLGRFVFRQERSPGIYPGLDLAGGQACSVNDRAVSQVGAIDSVWMY